MSKTRLAVCIGDEMYQNRFVKCLMNHYQNQFEVHIYTRLAEIQALDTQEYEVIIIGDCDKEGLESLSKREERVLYLKEEREESYTAEHIVFVDKYQEVYKIVDNIEKMTGTTIQNVKEAKLQKKNRQVIGVFSLTQEALQLPFVVTLCGICGEKQSVLLLDLQPFSGMDSGDENSGNDGLQESLGMEDMMAVSTTGVYTKGRLLSGIGRQANFEYVHTIKNPECLAEASATMYETMMDMLTKELAYDCIIINFGGMFSGMLELMESCDKCYLLSSKANEGFWRETAFREALERRGKVDLFRRITRFEIPTVYSADEDWRKLAERWRWNGVGNTLRQQLWVSEVCE